MRVIVCELERRDRCRQGSSGLVEELLGGGENCLDYFGDGFTFSYSVDVGLCIRVLASLLSSPAQRQ